MGEIGFLLLGAAFGAGVAGPMALLLARGKGAAETEAERARAAGLEERVREGLAAAARAEATARAAGELAEARVESLRAGHAVALEALERANAAEKAAHAQILAERDARIAQQDAYIQTCDQTLGKAFADASAKALNEALRDFDERAQSRFREEQERAGERSAKEKEEIERLLGPVQKELADLEALNKEMESSRAKAEGAMDERLSRLQQTSESLAGALKKPGVRGMWGEAQLASILEGAGMVEGANYRVQHHTEEDGEARRTDFVILLPKGREVVIDSKAPLDSYWAAMNATTEEERTRLAVAHARSVRGHFRDLKGKEYWRRYPGSPDCVFLFIPHEGAYQLACEHDKDLLADCHAHKIVLANPMTLMSLVHVAAYALQEDRMKGDIEKVRSVAVTLSERLGKVLGLVARHRSHLNAAVESYNAVVASVEGRLLPQTRALERLGVGDPKKNEIPTVLQATVRILPVPDEADERLALFEELEAS